MAESIGYARVSTADQKPELQLDALRDAGCDRIFTDHASGAKTSRPELDRALDRLRAGDTLVVWKLDRLGPSLPHLVETIKDRCVFQPFAAPSLALQRRSLALAG